MIRFVRSFMDSLSVKEDQAILICLQNDIPLLQSNIKQIEAVINDRKSMKKVINQIKSQNSSRAKC